MVGTVGKFLLPHTLGESCSPDPDVLLLNGFSRILGIDCFKLDSALLEGDMGLMSFAE